MATTDAEREELAGHLRQLLDNRLLDPIDILLAPGPVLDQLRDRANAQARAWADQLLDGTEQQAMYVVVRLVSALYPADEVFDPPARWWRTPLGQVTARRLGHPTVPAVTNAVAAAMLGVTRQGVHDLLSRGKLTHHPDGGVDVTSVRDRLRRRHDAMTP
ncbi:hypothetical protein [Actinopolymorpha pittospori]